MTERRHRTLLQGGVDDRDQICVLQSDVAERTIGGLDLGVVVLDADDVGLWREAIQLFDECPDRCGEVQAPISITKDHLLALFARNLLSEGIDVFSIHLAHETHEDRSDESIGVVRLGCRNFDGDDLGRWDTADGLRGRLSLGRDLPVLQCAHLALPGEVNLGGAPLTGAPHSCGEESSFDQQVKVGAGDVRVQVELVGNLSRCQGAGLQKVVEDGRAGGQSKCLRRLNGLVITYGHELSFRALTADFFEEDTATARCIYADGMQPDTEPLKLAISSCLIGAQVRFDGGHKKDQDLLEMLAPHVEWVSVCPEVEVGMGTPREPVKLTRIDGVVQMVGTISAKTHTASIGALASSRARELKEMSICGYVFKSKSPSCGLWDTPISGDERPGAGLFASAITQLMPDLPVEDETRLHDKMVRDNFIERAFAYRRLDGFFSLPRTRGQLVMFHSQSTLQLMSHSPADVQDLSDIIETSEDVPTEELAPRYRQIFMQALTKPTLRGHHVDALRIAVDRFAELSRDQKVEIAEAIDRYAEGQLPLLVPLTLISHHVRETKDAYLHGQTYLDPDPRESVLRYHA